MAQRRGVTLQEIVQTAAEMADREGLAGVTLSAVAERLQIRTPSLYNHVQGMDGLHNLLAINGLKALLAAVRRAKDGKTGQDGLLAAAEAYTAFAREHPGLYAAAMAAPNAEDPDYLQVSRELSEVLVEAVRECGIRGEEELHITRGLRSLLHGFAALEASGAFGMEIQVRDSLRYSVKRYILP
jgi:AcrR family transcriptional regulator